jgi:hypothetical protein
MLSGYIVSWFNRDIAMEFAFNRPLTADNSYQIFYFGAISMPSFIDWKAYLWISLGGI